MNTVLVWYLVTVYYGIHYSPPMPTLDECLRVKHVLQETYGGNYARCVQINAVKQ
jgi:hypothetical protein